MKNYSTPYIDIWFMLNRNQQRKLSILGYGPNCFMIGIPLETMRKVTTSKVILNKVIEMNKDSIRLVNEVS